MIMSVFIASSIALVIGLVYAILLKRKLAETIFPAIVLIIGILYCFGLLNHEGSLLYGIYFLIFLFILSVAYIIFVWVKKREQLGSVEILSGILLYLSFLFLTFLLSYGRVFQKWDEFTHWGFTAKHFFYMNAFGSVSHPYYDLWMPNYLPGTTLFQYFFSRFSLDFIEFHSYVGMKMLYFSMLMPFMKDIFTRKKFLSRILLLSVFGILPLAFSFSPYVVSTFYGSLFVDITLGLLFGIGIMYYYLYRYEESAYGIILVAGTTFMLALTKDVGFLLSLGICVIIVTDILCFRRNQAMTNIKRGKNWISMVGRIIVLLLPLLLTLFVNLSWSYLLVRANIQLNAYVPTILDMRNFLTGNLEPQQLQIRRNFMVAMWRREVPYLNLSTFWFSVIFGILVIGFSLLLSDKKARKRFILGGVCLGIGFYVYQFIFAILYVFTFHYIEGLRLSSFERYMATYMLGMALYLLMLLLLVSTSLDMRSIKCLKRVKVAIFAVVCVCSFATLFYTTSGGIRVVIRERVNQPENFRPRPTALAAERWGRYFVETPPYFIDQGGRWVNIRKMRYELMPRARLANVKGDYNIRVEELLPGESGFVTTPEAWQEHVFTSGYRTVYVFRSDETLETYFGHFFVGGVQEDMLYNVVNDDGSLLLIPVVEKD